MAYTTINKHTDHFNTKLWTGTGANLSITGVGHQPDFTWIKNRANTDDHNLFDVLRGFSTDSLLRSNTSGAATDTTEGIKSFDSDGFSLGNNGSSNGNGQGMVSWNWKANGAGSANTDGSINSTVSVNTTAGFSIVSYTGNETQGATVGHGLGVTPKIILVKNRDSTLGDGEVDWVMYHESTGNTKGTVLNSNAATETVNGFWNDTSPTSSVFTIGGGSQGGRYKTNKNNDGYIAYCFAEKTGYSKFGSVNGNGNASGTFVYTGFAPSFVLYRKYNGAGDWYFVDNKRPGYNDNDKRLYANTNQAEETYDFINLYSNGFKLTNSTHTYTNDSSGTYMYMAFGQSLVGSNNVPCTAR